MRTLRSSCCTPLLALVALLAAPAALAQDNAKLPYAQIPPDAFSVVAQVRAKPGKEGELRAAMQPLIASVRGEPKNLVYFLQEDRNTPGHFIVYLVYPSEADFEVHNATPHVQQFFTKLPDLAEGDVQVTKMRVMH